MNSFDGYLASFSGFVDFSSCCPHKTMLVIILGGWIIGSSVLSYMPQIVILNLKRTSFGLDPLTIFFNTLSISFSVYSFIFLHASDFVGELQLGLSVVAPTILSFINFFCCYVPCIAIQFLSLIFFDLEYRELRPEEAISAQWKSSVIFTVCLVGANICFFIVFCILCFVYGFASSQNQYYGEVLGIIYTAVNVIASIPQIVTTIRLKDKGSFSLVLLAFQGPLSFLNTCYMIWGQKESWSTWLPILASGIARTILLIVCVHFDIAKKKMCAVSSEEKTEEEEDVDGVDESNQEEESICEVGDAKCKSKSENV